MQLCVWGGDGARTCVIGTFSCLCVYVYVHLLNKSANGSHYPITWQPTQQFSLFASNCKQQFAVWNLVTPESVTPSPHPQFYSRLHLAHVATKSIRDCIHSKSVKWLLTVR